MAKKDNARSAGKKKSGGLFGSGKAHGGAKPSGKGPAPRKGKAKGGMKRKNTKGVLDGFQSKGGKRESRLEYIMPGNLTRKIGEFGYEYSMRTMVMTYLAYIGACVFTGYLFKLTPTMMVLLVVIGILFMPAAIVRAYYNKGQQQRFSDANLYMEQALYSFRIHNRVLDTLHDLESQFGPGQMRDDIIAAEQFIMSPPEESVDVLDDALKIIERDYRCDKLTTIHRFMCTVEELGGDFSQTVNLLLQDRHQWELRQVAIQKERKQARSNVILSIVVSIGLCVMFMRMLPSAYDISQNVLCQTSAVVMWFVMFALYSSADKKAAVDLLAGAKEMDPRKLRKRYAKIINWDDKAQFMKSVRYCVVFAVLTVISMWVFRNRTLSIVLAVISVAMLFQHKLDYKATRDSLVSEIHLCFPRWMIEMSLLLQTESVQVAIRKSYDGAPEILKPELSLLIRRLQAQPELSAESFRDFLGTFGLRDVKSAMSMLHSIQEGSGGDAEAQIVDIIERNNQSLEVAEKKAADNAMASLKSLFMAPLLIGGAKLMVDMMVFLMQSMGGMI